jgi:hypothetical protein
MMVRNDGRSGLRLIALISGKAIMDNAMLTPATLALILFATVAGAGMFIATLIT